VSKKVEMLDAITDLEYPDLLPCGLEALESEQNYVLSLIEAVEKEPSTNEIFLSSKPLNQSTSRARGICCTLALLGYEV